MKTTATLSFMGLIPFFVSFYFSLQSATWHLESKQVFIAYSAIILSFIAGTLWSRTEQEKQLKQQIISNFFSLFAFLALLIYHHLALILLMFSYVSLFLYERSLAKVHVQEYRPTPYLKMRLKLTVVVTLLQLGAFGLW